jgi:hypothetical protein
VAATFPVCGHVFPALRRLIDALATGMLEAMRQEGKQAEPMLERAIAIDGQR